MIKLLAEMRKYGKREKNDWLTKQTATACAMTVFSFLLSEILHIVNMFSRIPFIALDADILIGGIGKVVFNAILLVGLRLPLEG